MKSLWCLVGRHSWAVRKNEDGERYRECRRCTAIQGDPLPPEFGATAIGPPASG